MGGRPLPWQPGQVPVCPRRLVRCCQDMWVWQAWGLCGSSLGRKPGAGSTHSCGGVGQRGWCGGGRREEGGEWQTETRGRWSGMGMMGRRNSNEMMGSSLADEDSTVWCQEDEREGKEEMEREKRNTRQYLCVLKRESLTHPLLKILMMWAYINDYYQMYEHWLTRISVRSTRLGDLVTWQEVEVTTLHATRGTSPHKSRTLSNTRHCVHAISLQLLWGTLQ